MQTSTTSISHAKPAFESPFEVCTWVFASECEAPLAKALRRHSSFVAPVWKEMKSQPRPLSSQIVPSVSAVQKAGRSRVPAYCAATAFL